MKTLITILVFLLVGCASPDYAQYTASHQAIETAKHQADEAKYAAFAKIAEQGDATAKVAAVIAMMGQGGQAQQSSLQAPQPNQVLQWASILVPGLVQAYGNLRRNGPVNCQYRAVWCHWYARHRNGRHSCCNGYCRDDSSTSGKPHALGHRCSWFR